MGAARDQYLCPICLQKGWRRKVEIDIIGEDEWRWRCTYRRCEAAQDWQLKMEPVLDKKAMPKMGYEG